MAKPVKPWLRDDDLIEDAVGDTRQISGAPLPAGHGFAGELRGLLPPLFTVKRDNVNFNTLKAGHYDPASYYSALESSDTVVLPASRAVADAIGYDPTRTFHGGAGNDTVTGGRLDDLVTGGHGNDALSGNLGNDFLLGGEGHDRLYGAGGNDILYAGNGIDVIDAGAGDDIIVANEDDWLLHRDETVRSPRGGGTNTDFIDAGAGNDLILATSIDRIEAGDGDDRIELSDRTGTIGHAYVVGGDGNDHIIGSEVLDWINTGDGESFWQPDDWNAENRAAHGGWADTVSSGGGNDSIETMMYCTATVDTGDGDDWARVFGVRDVISMDDGDDELRLEGGTCKADLGAGDDTFVMMRSAYDNPTVSEVTLGAGFDSVHFMTRWWLTEGNEQSLSEAPWILDFDPLLDKITQIDVINVDDLSMSLSPRYFYAVNITSGSALIYDDPADGSKNFCLARFAGVSADALKANVDAHTEYAEFYL